MISTKKRLLSGVKPTGRPHIGNYFGAMKQFVDLQGDYETFVFIADLHALNSIQDKKVMQDLTKELILDYLGIGLDPKHCVIYKQSAIPAHASLTWVFDTLITVPFMMRAHAYKDAVAKNIEPSMGLFNYPVLMAADILLYDTDVVPVGKDQKQHIEYARDIALKFNNTYKELFKLPSGMILEEVETVPGTDGQKMSKSYGNTIPLFGTDKEIEKAVMSIVTDSQGKDEEKNPEELVLYQIHRLFNDSKKLKDQYSKGLGYGEAKKMLVKDIIDFITPMRERRKKYEDDPKLVEEILLHGAIKANELSMQKLQAVYEAVGLTQ
ncbi:MAG: tryptophan--tRNA ligase [Patescibacteria group bacterium]